MVLDGLRAYVQLAGGLTDVTRQRALSAARALLEQGSGIGGAVPGQVRDQAAALADDLVATSKANRELIRGLVEAEVERVAGRLGLVSAGELEKVSKRADRLDRRVRELELELAQTSGSPASAAGTSSRAGAPSASTTAATNAAQALASKTPTKSPKPTKASKTPTPRGTKPVADATASESADAPGGKRVRQSTDATPRKPPTRRPRSTSASPTSAATHGDALLDDAPGLAP
jgi:polyhydroxyalkanoate synthesis regulator phasin